MGSVGGNDCAGRTHQPRWGCHFAKRQITWFKRERDVIWVNKDEYGYDEKKILNSMMAELADDPAFGKIRG